MYVANNKLLLYEPERDATRAEWVIARCNGPRRTLHNVVPAGFAAYVRLLHPGWEWQAVGRSEVERLSVDDYEDRKRSTPVRWREVAHHRSRAIHREMQWWDIAPDSMIDTRSGRGGLSPPYDGEITLDMAECLFDILVRHSGENEECICAFWEGFGILRNVPDSIRVRGIGQQEHVLFHASLGAVRDQWRLVLKYARESSGLTPQAVWPVTRDWYFAVPFEMQSSYLGGSAELIGEIRSEERLETLEALPGDNLLHDNVDGSDSLS